MLLRAPVSPSMSTTERDKCGLSSFLPMSCRNRAEAFARRLHSRLRSLDAENDASSADESSWLAAHEASIALTQPRHAESEIFFNFDLLESPGSPEEETEHDLATIINNKDNLALSRCKCSRNGYTLHKKPSNDSDSSDGPYYDTEPEEKPYMNGFVSHDESEEGTSSLAENHATAPTEQLHCATATSSEQATKGVPLENHVQESPSLQDLDVFSDCNYESPSTSEQSAPVQSCNDEESTASLKDEDFPSLETSSSCQDLPQVTEESNGEVYSSSLNVEKDLTVECPLAAVQISKCDTIEVEEEAPKESRVFLEVNCRFDEDDDDLEKETPTPRVRRCSSLKTGKTPPGTPSRKKIVRFADVLGLDLADVRTFLDETPKIPTSAYDDLVDADLSFDSDSDISPAKLQVTTIKPQKILFPLFQQPGGQPSFLDMIKQNNVSLENAVVTDPVDLCISGTVRVRNLDFHKSVHIRYTLNAWETFADLQASYVTNSCDGFSDKFTFLLYAHTLVVGNKLEFAVRFSCKGRQYWDSNYGANYCFQCLPASNNTTCKTHGPLDDHWGASFY